MTNLYPNNNEPLITLILFNMNQNGYVKKHGIVRLISMINLPKN